MCGRWMLLVVCGVAACDDTLFGVQSAEADGGACDSTAPGYAGVQEIVAQNCLGCHNEAAALGGLNLETDLYAATVGVVGSSGAFLVAEGAPEDSLLYTRMSGDEGGPMPPTGLLDVSCTDVVKNWIADGALAE